MSFTDAVKFILSEYKKNQNNENSINNLCQKLDKKIKGINPSATSDSMINNPEILEELDAIGNDIRLIKDGIMILGSTDSRTIISIKKLFREEE